MKANAANLKAFSVVETVVSMVIIAVIMGLVFVIFSILSERMLDFKNQNQFVADMNRLTYILNKDIFENQNIIKQEENIAFVGYSGDITQYIRYQDYTIRSQKEFKDTFKIAITNMILDTVKSNNNRVIFNRLKVDFDVNKQKMSLRFYKKVYANQLIENCK